MRRGGAILSFPPDVAVIGQRDVGIERVVRDRFHGIRVRFEIRARDNPEVAVLGIDGVQAPIADLHPCDVVADSGDFPAFEMFRRNQHGKICLAARARECRDHIMFSALGGFDAENQHVLRHPTLSLRQIRTDAQSETFLAEQNVAPVARADRNNRVVLWKMTDEPPIRIDI